MKPSLIIDPFDKTGLSTSVLIYLLKQEEVECACLVFYFTVFLSCISSHSKQILFFDKRMRIMPTPYSLTSEIRAMGGNIVH